MKANKRKGKKKNP